MTASVRRFVLSIAVLGLVLLSGCDTVNDDPEVIILTREWDTGSDGSPLRFEFAADDTPTGETVTVRCGCTVDVATYLASQGFEPSDLVFATVQQAGLSLRFPVSGRINVLSSAVLRFEATGLQSTEVASQSTLPNARDADLNPIPNRDVSSFASKGAFEPVLQIRATDLQAGAEYEIDLSLTLRLELAGF